MLPRKGRLAQADRVREEEPAFVAARRQHPTVESAIHNLEHRGLDRVRAYGADGFARVVALSVLAFNIHRLGRYCAAGHCNGRNDEPPPDGAANGPTGLNPPARGANPRTPAPARPATGTHPPPNP